MQSADGGKPDGFVSRAREETRARLILEEESFGMLTELIGPNCKFVKSKNDYSLIDGFVYPDFCVVDPNGYSIHSKHCVVHSGGCVVPQVMRMVEIKRHPYTYKRFSNETDGRVGFLHTHKLLNLIDVCFQYDTDVLIMHVWAEEKDWSKVTIAVYSVRALYVSLWDSYLPSQQGLFSPNGAYWSPRHPSRNPKQGDVVQFDPLAANWISVWKETPSGFVLQAESPDVLSLLKMPTSTTVENWVQAQQVLGIPRQQVWPHLGLSSGPYGPPRFADVDVACRFSQQNSDKRTHPLQPRVEGAREPRGMGVVWNPRKIAKLRPYVRSLGPLPQSPPRLGNVVSSPYEIQDEAA